MMGNEILENIFGIINAWQRAHQIIYSYFCVVIFFYFRFFFYISQKWHSSLEMRHWRWTMIILIFRFVIYFYYISFLSIARLRSFSVRCVSVIFFSKRILWLCVIKSFVDLSFKLCFFFTLHISIVMYFVSLPID